jgi:lipid-A-disaccharide synthase
MLKRVMLIAGEASGDLHGAELVRAIQARAPRVAFLGIGGKAMAAAGVDIRFDAAALSVVGITEVVPKVPQILKGLTTVRRILRRETPDLLILIDFPDFNLMAAKAARRAGVKVLYYISPQIWAWRRGRVRTIARRVDHMAVILPFEADFYRHYGVPATYVGHPLIDQIAPVRRASKEPDLPVPPVIIALLPGSRNTEIERHLPLMLQSAALLNTQMPDLRFVIALPEGSSPDLVAPYRSIWPEGIDITVSSAGARTVLPHCQLALAVSGTVTLEAALMGVPAVVVYRVSTFSYLLGKLLVQVKYISLANLIVKDEVLPELIQHEASAETVAAQAVAILKTPGRLRQMRNALAAVRMRLGSAGAAERVAGIALEMMA